jgi:hypothetical protein
MASQVLSAAPPPSIKPSLAKHPQTNYPRWRVSAFEFAHGLCRGFDTYGALSLVMTEAEWRKLPHNTLTPATPATLGSPAVLGAPATLPSALHPLGLPAVLPVAAILPTPALPPIFRPPTDWNLPAPLAGGATHTVRDVWNRQYSKHHAFAEACVTLTEALFFSIGENLKADITHPFDFGSFDVTPSFIMNHLHNLYHVQTLSRADLTLLKAPLLTKLSSVAHFKEHYTTFRTAVKHLLQLHTLEPDTIFNMYYDSILHLPVLHSTLERFHELNPPSTHTYSLLAEHILPNLPYLIQTSASNRFAGAAVPPTPPPPISSTHTPQPAIETIAPQSEDRSLPPSAVPP